MYCILLPKKCNVNSIFKMAAIALRIPETVACGVCMVHWFGCANTKLWGSLMCKFTLSGLYSFCYLRTPFPSLFSSLSFPSSLGRLWTPPLSLSRQTADRDPLKRGDSERETVKETGREIARDRGRLQTQRSHTSNRWNPIRPQQGGSAAYDVNATVISCEATHTAGPYDRPSIPLGPSWASHQTHSVTHAVDILPLVRFCQEYSTHI